MGLIEPSYGTNDVVNIKRNGAGVRRRAGEYHVDLWVGVRRSWMVMGVLAALALAVLSPRAGATGGALHAQYVWYLPLSYIYWRAGRRRRGCGCGVRLVVVASAHAALVAPALCLLLLQAAQRSRVPSSLVHGVLMSSVSSGCGWLSLALCADPAGAHATAACHLVSLVTAPLAMILLCGRGVVPTLPLGPCAAALTSFGAGALAARWAPQPEGTEHAAQGCALLLLYMQCCDALQTQGSVRLEDMFAVLVLELSWLCASAAACWGYARCGLLAPRAARVVALCAVPRASQLAWQVCGESAGAALAQLPAVVLAPAQALLLAAIPDLAE